MSRSEARQQQALDRHKLRAACKQHKWRQSRAHHRHRKAPRVTMIGELLAFMTSPSSPHPPSFFTCLFSFFPSLLSYTPGSYLSFSFPSLIPLSFLLSLSSYIASPAPPLSYILLSCSLPFLSFLNIPFPFSLHASSFPSFPLKALPFLYPSK